MRNQTAVVTVPWKDGVQYTRSDSQWFRFNCGHDSPLYLNGKYTNTSEPGGHYDIGIQKFHKLGHAAPNIRIGMVDTGMAAHPRLPAPYAAINFNGSNPKDLSDPSGHGTMVAGLMSAHWDDNVVRGICCSHLAVARTGLRYTGLGLMEARAIKFLVDVGARIITLTWGSNQVSEEFGVAMEYAADSDVLIVCSTADAPGDYMQTVDYPSTWCMDNVISVAACDRRGELYWSTTGPYCCVAPGRIIISTYSDGGIRYGSGTSFAAAVVAGVAALIWEVEPKATAIQIKQAICPTEEPTLLNAEAALERLPLSTPDDSHTLKPYFQ